jgi:hypothetical protein
MIDFIQVLDHKYVKRVDQHNNMKIVPTTVDRILPFIFYWRGMVDRFRPFGQGLVSADGDFCVLGQ